MGINSCHAEAKEDRHDPVVFTRLHDELRHQGIHEKCFSIGIHGSALGKKESDLGLHEVDDRLVLDLVGKEALIAGIGVPVRTGKEKCFYTGRTDIGESAALVFENFGDHIHVTVDVELISKALLLCFSRADLDELIALNV